ncbi:Aste57867_973 [Aphanomyces stellatus]|uniref:Aste57867_973 protein n=1 Tax=Aphanomyces stellatus TaxID=120398 RepID=A0A485K493_9STRA|nr:hypothetical protein As57867_000972 [Aphanomyces stellatus]VFT78195.1 Aste57867_973 [Aphanomyces stellatus]
MLRRRTLVAAAIGILAALAPSSVRAEDNITAPPLSTPTNNGVIPPSPAPAPFDVSFKDTAFVCRNDLVTCTTPAPANASNAPVSIVCPGTMIQNCTVPPPNTSASIACSDVTSSMNVSSISQYACASVPTSTPMPTEASNNSSVTPTNKTPTNDASSNTGTILGVVGGLIAVAVISFLFVQQRRRSAANGAKASAAAADGVLDPPLDDVDDVGGTGGYMLAGSPPSRPTKDVRAAAAPTTPFFTYLASVDAFKPLWMSIPGGARTPALKGSHAMLQVTYEQDKHALKGIDFTRCADANLFGFCRAVQLVVALPPHPNVTRITGVAVLEVAQRFAVATELLNKGSLGHVLADPNLALTPAQQRQMCADVAAGLLHLHGLDCVYGALHPEKVLVHGTVDESQTSIAVTCKLNVLAMMDQAFVEAPQCAVRCGTLVLPYTAPELRDGGGTPTAASDVYALGVVMGQILTRALPFAQVYHDHGFVRGDIYLRAHPETEPYDVTDLVPPALQDLLRACWRVDPAKRPSTAAVVTALQALT